MIYYKLNEKDGKVQFIRRAGKDLVSGGPMPAHIARTTLYKNVSPVSDREGYIQTADGLWYFEGEIVDYINEHEAEQATPEQSTKIPPKRRNKK